MILSSVQRQRWELNLFQSQNFIGYAASSQFAVCFFLVLSFDLSAKHNAVWISVWFMRKRRKEKRSKKTICLYAYSRKWFEWAIFWIGSFLWSWLLGISQRVLFLTAKFLLMFSWWLAWVWIWFFIVLKVKTLLNWFYLEHWVFFLKSLLHINSRVEVMIMILYWIWFRFQSLFLYIRWYTILSSDNISQNIKYESEVINQNSVSWLMVSGIWVDENQLNILFPSYSFAYKANEEFIAYVSLGFNLCFLGVGNSYDLGI